MNARHDQFSTPTRVRHALAQLVQEHGLPNRFAVMEVARQARLHRSTVHRWARFCPMTVELPEIGSATLTYERQSGWPPIAYFRIEPIAVAAPAPAGGARA